MKSSLPLANKYPYIPIEPEKENSALMAHEMKIEKLALLFHTNSEGNILLFPTPPLAVFRTERPIPSLDYQLYKSNLNSK